MAFIPLYLMFVISLKDNAQFAHNPWFPTPPFHWENYKVGWSHVGASIWNTMFVAITSTFLSLVLAICGAFFFARYKMPGSTVLFYVFIVLMLYPGVANMVPTFKLISSLGLYNSHWALVLLFVTGAQAFTIYVMRNFIEDLPQDLFDAADVDGCPAWRQIWSIVVPLSSPIIGTLGVLRVIGEWNAFVDPLILLRDPHKQMIGVRLLFLEGEYTKKWGEMMSGYVIASIPLIILFFFCMRLFVRGLSEGAIKG
jgi:ABC-type glycerol-3-phosphate transport system permease component